MTWDVRSQHTGEKRDSGPKELMLKRSHFLHMLRKYNELPGPREMSVDSTLQFFQLLALWEAWPRAWSFCLWEYNSACEWLRSGTPGDSTAQIVLSGSVLTGLSFPSARLPWVCGIPRTSDAFGTQHVGGQRRWLLCRPNPPLLPSDLWPINLVM